MGLGGPVLFFTPNRYRWLYKVRHRTRSGENISAVDAAWREVSNALTDAVKQERMQIEQRTEKAPLQTRRATA